jgi:phosphoketolase
MNEQSPAAVKLSRVADAAAIGKYRRAVNYLAAAQAEEIIACHERKIADHRRYIEREGADPVEITNWQWNA